MAGSELEKLDLLGVLSGEVPLAEHDDQAVAMEIVQAILEVDTEDEVLALRSSIAMRDLVGRVLTVTSVKLRPSTLDDKQGVYALIAATDVDTGEVLRVNTGSPRVIAQLAWKAQHGSLDKPVRVAEVTKPSAGKNAAIGLVKP